MDNLSMANKDSCYKPPVTMTKLTIGHLSTIPEQPAYGTYHPLYAQCLNTPIVFQPDDLFVIDFQSAMPMSNLFDTGNRPDKKPLIAYSRVRDSVQIEIP
ncbi:hypothetical protein M0802_000265 [Mischocyttarus mexicanus]|nr:hypothetical protein M0802_000265 [Mischocyttarus mexicanus]